MKILERKTTLPKGWHLARFDEFLHRIERKIIIDDSAFYNCVGVRWYGMGAFVREHEIGMNITRKQQWVVNAGDIIYNKLFAWKNAFAIADATVDNCIVSDKFPTYQADESIINLKFLHYYFLTKGLGKQALDLSKGGAAISKLTLNPPQFWDLRIPLPPLSEQQRIVAQIEELVAKIEEAQWLLQQATKDVEAILSSVLTSLFEGDRAKRWVHKKLVENKLATVVAGQHIMADEYNLLGEGFPYITGPADFGSKVPEIKRWTLTPKSVAFPGDILLTVKGAGVGKINFAPDINIVIGRQIMAIRPDKDYLLQDFVYFFLKHKLKYFQSIATATTVPGFKKTDVEELEIPLPPLNKQKRIVTYLVNVQSKVDTLKRIQSETSAELNAMLPSILDRAFKGEL